jgi:D-inositol-3-phosphate glycosyltransferase
MPLLEPKPQPAAEPSPAPVPKPDPAELLPDGCLDLPETGAVARRGLASFHGWALFPAGPPSRVDLWLGEEPLGPARLGLPRPDVCAALGLKPGAATGFELTANLEDWPGNDGGAVLRARVIGPDGERLELEPLALRVTTPVASPGPRLRAPSPGSFGGDRGLRTLVATHQLDLGGAQLYLIELLRELLRTEAVEPTVISAKDGLLRGELEALGVPVHVTGAPPTNDLGTYLAWVDELTLWAAARDFEVAFVNTATSHVLPAVEAVDRLGVPAVWTIHESFTTAELWNHLDPAIRRRAETALAAVSQPLFVATATERQFEPASGRGRGLTIPYGLDLKPIDSCRAGFDRAASRRARGIPEEAEVVLCVGSIEPRKAQMPLAQAFARIADRHPLAQLVFVGGRDDLYTEGLLNYAASCAAAGRIEVVPMTPDVQPWFGLADLVVCASDVESLPRVAVEAMAWETPVLATSVFGLPELIADGENGWLCEPRDLDALSAGLERALRAGPAERRRLGRAGRLLVEERHDLSAYGAEVAALLARIAGGPSAVRLVDAAAG